MFTEGEFLFVATFLEGSGRFLIIEPLLKGVFVGLIKVKARSLLYRIDKVTCGMWRSQENMYGMWIDCVVTHSNVILQSLIRSLNLVQRYELCTLKYDLL